MVSDTSKTMLGDFGFTRAVDTTTSAALQGGGSVPWMSPELLEGSGKTFDSDTWAFGMVIYEVSVFI